jgi:cytochrome c
MARGSTWLAAMLAVLPVRAEAQDAEAGATVFKKCAVCHSVKDQTRKIGPTLNGVIGRTAGTLEGFRYSGAMVLAGEGGLVWNADEIATFITDPKKMIPGTSMAFSGLKKPEDVANVIAFIKQYSPAN